jgi:hypothetical protein
MKIRKMILYLFGLVATFNQLNAQHNWNGDKIVCEKRKYEIERFASGRILLYASSNKLRNDKMNLPSEVDFYPDQLAENNQEILKNFRTVFSETKLQQLAKGQNLHLIFYITSEGCVTELAFLFPSKLPIAIQDFFELEKLLIGKKIFTVPMKFKNVNFLRFSRAVNFSKVYNNKE